MLLGKAALAAIVAVGAAQTSPCVRTSGTNLVTDIPAGDSLTNLNGGAVIARRANEATIELPSMRTLVNAKISNMTAAVSQTSAVIVQLRSTLSAQTAALAADLAGVRGAATGIRDQVTAQTSAAQSRNAQNSQAVVGFSRMIEASKSAAEGVRDIYSTLSATQQSVATAVLSASLASEDLLNRQGETVMTAVTSSLSASTSAIDLQLAPLTPLGSAMSTSHYMNPAIPVYRWMMFHVYSNNGIGWFDGNNVRFFGGRNPSNWGDGNARVWDMHASIPYIARLFTRRGVGTPLGATVCSETWYLYSSTDTKYCIALFRIKNTAASAVRWAINWYGTGWSGWGNQQSMTNSRQQNWAGSCTWWCHRSYTFILQASAQRDRISTLIFANGMTHPNHYADNHHIEATFLGFDGLTPPAGLEFVDDLSTATGQWR